MKAAFWETLDIIIGATTDDSTRKALTFWRDDVKRRLILQGFPLGYQQHCRECEKDHEDGAVYAHICKSCCSKRKVFAGEIGVDPGMNDVVRDVVSFFANIRPARIVVALSTQKACDTFFADLSAYIKSRGISKLRCGPDEVRRVIVETGEICPISYIKVRSLTNSYVGLLGHHVVSSERRSSPCTFAVTDSCDVAVIQAVHSWADRLLIVRPEVAAETTLGDEPTIVSK